MDNTILLSFSISHPFTVTGKHEKDGGKESDKEKRKEKETKTKKLAKASFRWKEARG
jgi:hypothetical protein